MAQGEITKLRISLKRMIDGRRSTKNIHGTAGTRDTNGGVESQASNGGGEGGGKGTSTHKAHSSPKPGAFKVVAGLVKGSRATKQAREARVLVVAIAGGPRVGGSTNPSNSNMERTARQDFTGERKGDVGIRKGDVQGFLNAARENRDKVGREPESLKRNREPLLQGRGRAGVQAGVGSSPKEGVADSCLVGIRGGRSVGQRASRKGGPKMKNKRVGIPASRPKLASCPSDKGAVSKGLLAHKGPKVFEGTAMRPGKTDTSSLSRGGYGVKIRGAELLKMIAGNSGKGVGGEAEEAMNDSDLELSKAWRQGHNLREILKHGGNTGVVREGSSRGNHVRRNKQLGAMKPFGFGF